MPKNVNEGNTEAASSGGAATEWLPPEIEKDGKGFVQTGEVSWRSRPGVLAAGDMRSGSVKRAVSAVGEGATAMMFVHEYLKTM